MKDAPADFDFGRLPWITSRGMPPSSFCRRLSDLPAEKKAGRVYRLPTEAEWEYACRAGTTTVFSVGNTLSSTQANFNGTIPFGTAAKGPFLNRTATVGSYKPNAFA